MNFRTLELMEHVQLGGQGAAVRSLKLTMARLMRGRVGQAVQAWHWAASAYARAFAKQEEALSRMKLMMRRMVQGEQVLLLQHWSKNTAEAKAEHMRMELMEHVQLGGQGAAVRSLGSG